MLKVKLGVDFGILKGKPLKNMKYFHLVTNLLVVTLQAARTTQKLVNLAII